MRDDRATIAAAEWNERKLRVRLIAGLPLDRLEVHIVARNASPGIWLPLEAPVIEVELGDLPGDAQVFVLDRSGEVLAAANAGRASMSAPMDAPETPNVLADIRDGERDDVEFKPWIERCGTKERDLLKTIIAFANTRGGRLYVGVDDEGTALSTSFLHRAFKQSDVEAGLRAAAARLHEICTNIHPTPVRTVTLVTIATGRCLRVLVDPGPDPPYMTVDSHEIWVRRGASSLRPLRAELEKWFRPDQIPALYLPNV